jgi:hypothetical protein
MVRTSYSSLSSFFKIIFLGGLIMNVCINISGTAISLLYTSDDCDNSIRFWLIVQSSTSLFILTVYIYYKLFGFSLWILWTIAWGTLGTIWAFGDDNCRNDFSYGFIVAAMIVSVNFFILSIIFAFACTFGIAACIGQGLTNKYNELGT